MGKALTVYAISQAHCLPHLKLDAQEIRDDKKLDNRKQDDPDSLRLGINQTDLIEATFL